MKNTDPKVKRLWAKARKVKSPEDVRKFLFNAKFDACTAEEERAIRTFVRAERDRLEEVAEEQRQAEITRLTREHREAIFKEWWRR